MDHGVMPAYGLAKRIEITDIGDDMCNIGRGGYQIQNRDFAVTPRLFNDETPETPATAGHQNARRAHPWAPSLPLDTLLPPGSRETASRDSSSRATVAPSKAVIWPGPS